MRKKASTGFTLIEVLIALSIFALIGLTAHHVLTTISSANERVDEYASNLARLQKASLIMKRDFLQITDRGIQSEYAEKMPALTTRGIYKIEFSHVGWRNPLGLPRSETQRVAYDVKDGKLIRYYWSVLDRAQDTKPQMQEILDGVEEISFVFTDNKKQSRNEWPALLVNKNEKAPLPLPVVIELTFKMKKDGEIKWMYVIGDFYELDAPAN